jgi:hypothetical protein
VFPKQLPLRTARPLLRTATAAWAGIDKINHLGTQTLTDRTN